MRGGEGVRLRSYHRSEAAIGTGMWREAQESLDSGDSRMVMAQVIHRVAMTQVVSQALKEYGV